MSAAILALFIASFVEVSKTPIMVGPLPLAASTRVFMIFSCSSLVKK